MLKLIYYLFVIPLYLPVLFIKLVFFPFTFLCGIFKELEENDKYYFLDHF